MRYLRATSSPRESGGGGQVVLVSDCHGSSNTLLETNQHHQFRASHGSLLTQPPADGLTTINRQQHNSSYSTSLHRQTTRHGRARRRRMRRLEELTSGGAADSASGGCSAVTGGPGKAIELIAIVRHGSLANLLRDRTTALEVPKENKLASTKDTHEDDDDIETKLVGANTTRAAEADKQPTKKGKFHLSKLFISRSKYASKEIAREQASALIDHPQNFMTGAGGDPNRRTIPKQPAMAETTNYELMMLNGSVSAADNKRPADQDGDQFHIQGRQPQLDCDSDKVIEFKFDLIVEDDNFSAGDHAATCGFPLLNENEKLASRLNGSVESFVLDSQDVCLMSVGRHARKQQVECSCSPAGEQQTQQFTDNCNKSNSNKFGFTMSQLTRNTLAHSFELLTRPMTQTSQPPSADSDKSIEISATLLIGANWSPATPPTCDEISVVNLLNESCDCHTLDEALIVLSTIERNLSAQVNSTGKTTAGAPSLLLISLKLKRRINGGLFSNRMCLLDFDPKLGSQLEPILVEIFKGQALAYLKRRKLQLEAMESPETNSQPDHEDEELERSKHRHQVASKLEKLIQAEWFLYKQLSSALIRALIIVNVHKLAGEDSELLTKEWLSTRIMSENLTRLQFACSLQRAAAGRLKRRKRHLKNHLVSSTASIASNASATTTTAHIGLTSAASAALFGSPHRFRTTRPQHYYAPTHDSLVTNCHRSRKSSLDVGGLAIVSRRRSRHLSHYYQCSASRGQSRSGRRVDRITDAKLAHWLATAQLEPAQVEHDRRQQFATNGSNVFNHSDSFNTESSSMSTHSSAGTGGRHRRQQVAAVSTAAGRLANNWRHHGSRFSDSDSITSCANLHSCCDSSSSRNKKHIDLDWISKDRQHKLRDPPETRSPINAENGVIQIDCQPLKGVEIDDDMDDDDAEEDEDEAINLGTSMDDNTDNVSDICSVVAEPPKQLKLEEFLSKLSNVIRIDTDNVAPTNVLKQFKVSQDNVNAKRVESNIPTTATVADDEDEDCKSHSSILEHLSSLAMESNSKLSHRQEQQEQREREQPLVVANRTTDTGHLQKLLNSASKQPAKADARNNLDIEQRLKALTVDCYQQTCLSSPISTPISVFTSSNDSSCGSSSSASSTSTSNAADSGNNVSTEAPPPPRANNLYASVIRNRHNVKI